MSYFNYKIMFVVFLLLFIWTQSEAAHPNSMYSAFIPQKNAFFVIDTTSGTILHQKNADKVRYPASLTKLMTLYLTFEALHRKRMNFDSQLIASYHACAQPSMRIPFNPGELISVNNLIKSLIVVSANDSAVVLAEKIAGSEKEFTMLMNQKARRLGMKHTNFSNSTGLHHSKQVTTARDMAKLMIAIKRDFPEYYHLLSLKSFNYKGEQYYAHTRLIKNYKWAKAAKTGYINQSGFNLVLNAHKNNKNLVAVIMGGRSALLRDNFARALLDQSFQTQYKPKHRYVNRYSKSLKVV